MTQTIGTHTYFGGGCELRDLQSDITIGDYCSFGDGVLVLGGLEHRTECVSTFPFIERYGWEAPDSGRTKGPVMIGSDVWVGSRVIILSGVTIGNGAVIGAGAVVTHDIPCYAVAAGVPARVLRMRFDDETVARLLEIAWWNWSEETVTRYASLLAGDPTEFLERV